MIASSELTAIYRDSLSRCEPEGIAFEVCSRMLSSGELEQSMSIVAMGKAAPSLHAGAAQVLKNCRSFVAAPAEYLVGKEFGAEVEVAPGGHPLPDQFSFQAGLRLRRFVTESREPILFLVSGGSSACVELPRSPPFSEDDLVHVNRLLIRAGLPIEKINRVRKQFSALKGGRLGRLAPPGSVALIFSDVRPGEPEQVGSGPTFADSTHPDEAASILQSLGDERCDAFARAILADRTHRVTGLEILSVVIADNRTLIAAAGSAAQARGFDAQQIDAQIEGDVRAAAGVLLDRLRSLPEGTLLVAGGEPTVEVRGTGRGGRCTELAVHVALAMTREERISALFGSSDGVDGNSGLAATVLDSRSREAGGFDREAATAALERSDTVAAIGLLGEGIRLAPTGNNLRDLYLLSRGAARMMQS